MDQKEVDYSKYKPEQIKAMKEAERFNPVTTLGIQFTKHFRNYPCFDFGLYSTLFSQYNQHGTLPYPGSLTEQPNKIIEIFNMFRSLIAEAENKERKKHELQNKRRK